MKPAPSPKPKTARERLIDAASDVFGSKGIATSTTREIARLAGVNEVTLFRHFHNKEGLVAAVVGRTLDHVHAENPVRTAAERKTPASLTETLRTFAQMHHALIVEHLPLIRTFIAEMRQNPEHGVSVMKEMFRQRRQQLITDLRHLQRGGLIRGEVDVMITADQLSGMLFADVLRRACVSPVEYGITGFIDQCIELVVQGISVSPSDAVKRTRKKG